MNNNSFESILKKDCVDFGHCNLLLIKARVSNPEIDELFTMSRGYDEQDVVTQFRWEIRSGLMFAIYFSLPWFFFALCSCMNICCGTPTIIGARKSQGRSNLQITFLSLLISRNNDHCKFFL